MPSSSLTWGERSLRRMARGRILAALIPLAVTACDSAGDPVDITDTGGDITGSVVAEGLTRTFVLHVAPPTGPRQPAPLLIAFHGTNMDGAAFQDLTVFERFADEHEFFIAYLDGIDGGWSIGCGCTTPDLLGLDDTKLVTAVIEGLAADLAIDLDRVYLAGFSQGGNFAQIAACTLSDRIAGVASVGATLTQRLADSCLLERGMPVLMIHGTEDGIVPFDGNATFLSAEGSLARWAELDGCQGDPVEGTEPDRDPNDLTRVRTKMFSDCADGAEVGLYTVEGGGHTWPLGERPLTSTFGVVSQDIAASEVITEFFLRHSLP